MGIELMIWIMDNTYQKEDVPALMGFFRDWSDEPYWNKV